MAVPVSGISVGTSATSSESSPHLPPQPTFSPSTATSASTSVLQHSATSSPKNMKLDLLMLTFNCAKAAIDVGTFATHLYSALVECEGAMVPAQLPELVVLSLQEVAPLPNAFIGGALLDLYLRHFEEALNLAALNATKCTSTAACNNTNASAKVATASNVALDPTALTSVSGHRLYSLVKSHNVGMTAIMILARSPAALGPVQVAEVGFGAAGMGNKGAVGLRTVFTRDGSNGSSSESTELTFIAAHLAAMESNLEQRNTHWLRIMRELTFDDPARIFEEYNQTTAHSASEKGQQGQGRDTDLGSENIGLLAARHRRSKANLNARLHELSVFKPSSHLFIGGDLNYRISSTPPPPNAAFPSPNPASPHYFEKFLPLDQLTQERKAGRTLHGMTEAPVSFPPTYKYKALARIVPDDQIETHVPAVFAQHRYPSWTDRILYLDTPPWLRNSGDADGDKEAQSTSIDVHKYMSLPLMRSSDHQPVYLRVSVPLISRSLMTPSPMPGVRSSGFEQNHESDGDSDDDSAPELPDQWRSDPRAFMPVSIDANSWLLRRQGRRREWAVGWAGAVWSTRQGALVLATALSLVAATYLAVQNFYEFE
ncbi:hypothetical protein Cpir12675_002396 [Ceratocystis pirilliformis]|uniref:Inositol polyphosphate-related phosphatase domain-containing protein n=1 Tax=Ceratocystis pirilliformis TaxID=259994 RepID=A0ABR3ZAG5_9PEZI